MHEIRNADIVSLLSAADVMSNIQFNCDNSIQDLCQVSISKSYFMLNILLFWYVSFFLQNGILFKKRTIQLWKEYDNSIKISVKTHFELLWLLNIIPNSDGTQKGEQQSTKQLWKDPCAMKFECYNSIQDWLIFKLIFLNFYIRLKIVLKLLHAFVLPCPFDSRKVRLSGFLGFFFPSCCKSFFFFWRKLTKLAIMSKQNSSKPMSFQGRQPPWQQPLLMDQGCDFTQNHD